jgi:hypothetical protein
MFEGSLVNDMGLCGFHVSGSGYGQLTLSWPVADLAYEAFPRYALDIENDIPLILKC